MKAREYVEQLKYLEACIRTGRVEGVQSIQAKFGCCEKTARNMIIELKEMGIPISYSRTSRKYYIDTIS